MRRRPTRLTQVTEAPQEMEIRSGTVLDCLESVRCDSCIRFPWSVSYLYLRDQRDLTFPSTHQTRNSGIVGYPTTTLGCSRVPFPDGSYQQV